MGLVLTLFSGGAARPGSGQDLLELQAAGSFEAACRLLASDTDTALTVAETETAAGTETATHTCAPPGEAPWMLRIVREDGVAHRLTLAGMQAAGEGRASDREPLMTYMLALDDARSLTLPVPKDLTLSPQPASRENCTPLDRLGPRLAPLLESLQTSEAQEESDPEVQFDYACLPPEGDVAILSDEQGRIGRLGLAPEALDRLAEEPLSTPQELGRALQEAVPTNMGDLRIRLNYGQDRRLSIKLGNEYVEYAVH